MTGMVVAGSSSLLMGVLTFFAYKILTVAKQVSDLHDWHNKTNEKGEFLWYGKGADVIDELKEHIRADAKHWEQIHSKIACVQMQCNDIQHKIQLVECKKGGGP